MPRCSCPCAKAQHRPLVGGLCSWGAQNAAEIGWIDWIEVQSLIVIVVIEKQTCGLATCNVLGHLNHTSHKLGRVFTSHQAWSSSRPVGSIGRRGSLETVSHFVKPRVRVECRSIARKVWVPWFFDRFTTNVGAQKCMFGSRQAHVSIVFGRVPTCDQR